MSENPELDQAYRETAMALRDNLDKPLIAHNDAADGFECDPFPDPGERLRGDPEAEADEDGLEAALERAMEAFKRDGVKLSEFEALVRTRLASFGPSLGDRLEQLTKQLAKIEANIAFVVSYVNTLALPVRDPLDLPEPPAGAAEYIEAMKAATDEVLGRRPDIEPIPPSPIHVDPRDPGLGSQAVNPNDPIDCTHPNDCQFPRCLCGTEFAAMGGQIGKTPERVAIESTRGPYAKVYDQNHVEPACTHTTTGAEITGRTSYDGGHPMKLSEPEPLKPPSGAPSQEWESGNAYWIGSDGTFYVLDPKDVKPLARSKVPSFQVIAGAIGAYWWDCRIPTDQLIKSTNDGWRLTTRAADSLASHVMNVLTGAPNWPSPVARPLTQQERPRGPEVLSGYDARTFAKSQAILDGAMDDIARTHNAQAKAEIHKTVLGQVEVVSDPHRAPTFVQPINHASPLHEAIYELSKELEAHQANSKAVQDRVRAIAILLSPAALSIALQACQQLNAAHPLRSPKTPDHVLAAQHILNGALESLAKAPDKDRYLLTREQVHTIDSALNTPPAPTLLDQARQTNDAVWTRILNEDTETIRIAGNLRQALSSPAFTRAWGTIQSLVDARHILHTDDHIETLVLRLDAVRAMHKVLLAVRSAVLQKCHSAGAGHG